MNLGDSGMLGALGAQLKVNSCSRGSAHIKKVSAYEGRGLFSHTVVLLN
jgi:hypothetical protein